MNLSSDFFQQVVEQASDIILLLDTEGAIVYANAATSELFGRPPGELIGESFGHVVTTVQPTEIQISHAGKGVVTADIRSSRVMLAGQSFEVVYLRDVTERKLNELTLIETSLQLGERVKEQSCIRRVAEILLQSNDPQEEVFQKVVDVLPPGWQYPEITVARITLGDRVYTSEGFSESAWRQSEPIPSDGMSRATVEVFYTEERPEASEGPFLEEERQLLKLIVIKISHALSRRQANIELLRINRSLRMLAAVNRELVRAKHESALLKAVCQVCVDLGGYRMAWVGFAEQDGAKSVRPMAQAGFDDGYLESIFISWADDDHGKGPAGRAIQTGKPQVSQNFATDPSMTPWCDTAQSRGYHSGVALPLKDASGAFGMLEVYSHETDIFGGAEVLLLEELADDLAYGVVTLRSREQHKMAEEQIAHLAYFDELTELPNQTHLKEVLAQATAQLRSGEQCALLTLDVMGFGDIQAGIGMEQAEDLLRKIVARIQDALESSELLARMGGDEFAVLLSNGGVDAAADCAQRIEHALRPPLQQAGIPISVQMRIGVALAPDHGIKAEPLMMHSGMAVRRAKQTGAMFKVFSGPTESESPHHLELITQLRTAIETKQLVLHYQPKVDVVAGNLSGVEALVRWPHPTLGFILPGRFINMAEQTGLINPLTEMVLDAALHQCSLWHQEGFDIPVAVNISASNLRDADFVSRLAEMLRQRGVSAEQLHLELTESTLMEEPTMANNMVKQLNNLGIKILIDDFGTGYSSLNYVANLPIYALKIDRSFVIRMLESARTRSVVDATISLAHSLGIRTVAEGVETKQQVETLMALGCTEIQGYYFARPLEAEALRRWAAEFSLADYALFPGPADPGRAYARH